MRQKNFIVVILAALMLTSCGAKIPPIPTTVPPVVSGSVEAMAANALLLLYSAAIVGRESGKLYLQVSKGIVPADADKKIRSGFIAFADEGQRAVAKIKAGVKSWDEIKTAVNPVLKTLNDLVAVVNQLQATARTGGWFELLKSVVGIVTSAQGGTLPVPEGV